MRIKVNHKVSLIILIITIILLIINLSISNNIIKNKEKIVTQVNMTNNLPEIYKKVKPAVVQIIAETNASPDSYSSSEIIKTETGWASFGTGFFIDSQGYIATANHVVAGSDKIIIRIYEGGKFKELEAKIINQKPKLDLAVIKVEGDGFPALEFKEYSEVNEGEKVGFSGFPLGIQFPIVSEGLISSKITANLYGEESNTYVIGGFVNSGNSGGPLFSLEDGKVIGVINAKRNLPVPNLYISKPENLGQSGGITMSGISWSKVVEVVIDNRNIMLELAGKNSQTGIGFSVSTDYIGDYKK